MFGIGGFELFLILLFGFLVFGPDKLPAIAKTVGKAIGKFRSAQEEMNKVIKTEVYDPNSDEPFKNPLDALSKISEVGKSEEKTESFSERKAKYDKERAAKKAAEEKKAAAGTATAAGAAVAAKKATDDAKADGKTDEKPKPSADELYGNKPAAAKKTTSQAKAKADGAESVEKKPAARSAAKPSTASADKAAAAKPATAAKSASALPLIHISEPTRH